MLRIALPNKGSLSELTVEMLRAAGYRTRTSSRDLVVLDRENDIEFFYLRPRDIATYVGSGVLDAGITGRDLLLDSDSEAVELAELGFGDSTFRFAGPSGGGHESVADVAGLRIATSYPTLVGRHLAEHGVEARLVRLDGAVESAIQLGVADVVADVVSTGATLKAAGLAIFGEVIARSSAVFIDNPKRETPVETVLRRLEGVRVAREYVLIDYDISNALLDEAVRLTPGFEAPTISPLQGRDWVAVRSMVLRTEMNRVLDDLHAAGARAILVTPIHAARM